MPYSGIPWGPPLFAFCITDLAQRGNKAETNKKPSAQGEEAKQKEKKGKKKENFSAEAAQVRAGAVTNIANWLGVQGINLQKSRMRD